MDCSRHYPAYVIGEIEENLRRWTEVMGLSSVYRLGNPMTSCLYLKEKKKNSVNSTSTH